MNMKKLICGIVALMLMALAITGCPTGTTPEGTTYVLSGTVTTDIDNVDLTRVSIQLVQNGKPVFKPVHPAADGSFEISGVPAGDGFTVMATLDGFAIAETDVFNVPEEGAGLELKLRPVASISGSVTVDDDADLTKVDVTLSFMEGKLQTIHPDAKGNYVFTGVGQRASVNYKVSAELDGFDKAISQLFALTGDYAVPVLALTKIPPEITGCDFVEADKLIITFSGPVEYDDLDGFEFVADFGDLSIESDKMNGDCELELIMSRPINPIEEVDVHYDSTKQSLRQKGTERYLHRYSDWATKSFAAEKPLGIMAWSVKGSSLTIVWSKSIDTNTFKTFDGWSISSDNGAIGFASQMLNNGQMAMVILSRASATGDVITLSYDDTVGSVKAADSDTKLASFTATYTVE